MVSRGPDADVLVVGAGLAGLTAADRLRRDGLRALLLERDREPGGRACSEQWQGCALDLGATFVIPSYRRVRRLIEECGMGDRLTPVANAFRVAIRRHGRWHLLDFHSPETAVARYSGIGWRDKAKLGRLLPYQLRVAASVRKFDVASAAAVDSKSLEEVIGPVANRYFSSGLVEVLCGYSPDQVSLAFGVVGGRYPIRRAWTLRGGIGSLTGELGRRSEARCGVAVESVRVEGQAVVAQTRDGETLRARAAILATLAPQALELWPQAPERTRRFLSGQGYSQGFGVILRTSAPVRRTDRRGRGVYMDMLPRDERTGALLAVVYANDLAPDGGLIGIVASHEASAADLDDGELATRLEFELTELHPEMNPQITARRTLRWPTFMPTYPAGRARDLAAFRAGFAPGPIQLAGDYLYGPMMEAAARAGEEAAERASTYVNEARAP